MARVGYARVSSTDQILDVQLAKLKDCDKVFEEHASGIDANRPALAECLRYLREGDVLVITRIDRLARSSLHLCVIAEKLQREHIDLVVLDQAIDTTTTTGRLLFNMLGAIAQFETEIRAERQREGIRKAKERGVYCGASKKLTPADVETIAREWGSGVSRAALARRYHVDPVTIWRYLKNRERSEVSGTPGALDL